MIKVSACCAHARATGHQKKEEKQGQQQSEAKLGFSVSRYKFTPPHGYSILNDFNRGVEVVDVSAESTDADETTTKTTNDEQQPNAVCASKNCQVVLTNDDQKTHTFGFVLQSCGSKTSDYHNGNHNGNAKGGRRDHGLFSVFCHADSRRPEHTLEIQSRIPRPKSVPAGLAVLSMRLQVMEEVLIVGQAVQLRLCLKIIDWNKADKSGWYVSSSGIGEKDWLVCGRTRAAVRFEADKSCSVTLDLVPLVAGRILLPKIQVLHRYGERLLETIPDRHIQWEPCERPVVFVQPKTRFTMRIES